MHDDDTLLHLTEILAGIAINAFNSAFADWMGRDFIKIPLVRYAQVIGLMSMFVFLIAHFDERWERPVYTTVPFLQAASVFLLLGAAFAYQGLIPF